MTANVIVKHKDKTPIGIEEVSELIEFCDATFGVRSNGSYWFEHFATDRDTVYSTVEDIDESFNSELFNEYTNEHPEMNVYVEYVM